jgi:hypothetical protein
MLRMSLGADPDLTYGAAARRSMDREQASGSTLAFGVQRLAFNVQRSTFNVQRSTFTRQ